MLVAINALQSKRVFLVQWLLSCLHRGSSRYPVSTQSCQRVGTQHRWISEMNSVALDYCWSVQHPTASRKGTQHHTSFCKSRRASLLSTCASLTPMKIVSPMLLRGTAALRLTTLATSKSTTLQIGQVPLSVKKHLTNCPRDTAKTDK